MKLWSKIRLIAGLLLVLQASNQVISQDCKSEFRTIMKEARASYPNAITRLDSIISICHDGLLTEDQDTLALMYHIKGVYLSLLQQYEQAIQANFQALEIRENQQPPNLEKIGHSHFNLGVCYNNSFQYHLAKKHYQIALDTLIKQENHRRTGEAFSEMASTLWRTHDYELAKDYAIRGLHFYRKSPLSAKIQRNTGLSYMLMGAIHSNQFQMDSASAQFNLALQTFESYPAYSPLIQLDKAKCWNNLGDISYKLRDYPTALSAYQTANDILQQADIIIYPQAKEILASTLIGISVVRKLMDQYKLSFHYLHQSDSLRKILYPSLRHPSFTEIYNNTGDLLVLEDQFSKALQQYHVGIQQLVPAFTSDDLLENPLITDSLLILGAKSYLLTSLQSKAQTLRHLAKEVSAADPHIQSALDLYHQADHLIQRMRKEHMNDGSKLFWIEHSRPIYEEAIHLCYEIGDIQQAYEFAEKSMASLLLAEVNNLNAKALTGISPKSLKKEQNLKEQIRTYEARLENVRHQPNQEQQIAAYQQTLSRLRIEFQAYLSKLEQESPTYFQHKYQSTVVSLTQVQQHLEKQSEASAILQYFTGDSALYLFCILPDTAYLWQMDHPYARIQSFFQTVADTSDIATPANWDRLALNSYEVYRSLLGPIRQQEISLPKRLTIIPDGYLARIPFETLITNPNKTSPDIAYLLREHICRYGPSASILLSQRPNRQAASRHILGIAPVRFATYNNLMFSEIEVNNIIQLLGGKALTLEQATKANVLEQLSNYRVLHFSTHAQANSNLLPFIAFRDTSLFLPEIYSLNTRAEMVALSACETLLGDEKKGEGLMSLARAFQFIGVPSLAASLWQVSDKSTQQIMTDFYRYLSQGMDKDQALHQAKIDYLDQHGLTQQAPFYWAPLILVGDNSELSFRSQGTTSNIWLIAGLVFLLLLAGVLIWRSKSRHMSANR
ncbi:MAG: CHAT domain-containing tetratricopeptide repeat protein [Bacteroidota bacterium]